MPSSILDIVNMKSLSSDELIEAQAIIDQAMPGIYELREIYGLHWDSVVAPTVFGKRFKAAVDSTQLQGIEKFQVVEKGQQSKRSNNHLEYRIFKQ